jgi:hypothetical protein
VAFDDDNCLVMVVGSWTNKAVLHHARGLAAKQLRPQGHRMLCNPHRSARSARAEAKAAMPANERKQCVAITAPGCNHKVGVMAQAAQAIIEGLCRSVD